MVIIIALGAGLMLSQRADYRMMRVGGGSDARGTAITQASPRNTTTDFTLTANQWSFPSTYSASREFLPLQHRRNQTMKSLVMSLVASIGRVAEALQLSKRAPYVHRKPLAGPRPGAWLPG
jgi:hypothetical protein